MTSPRTPRTPSRRPARKRSQRRGPFALKVLGTIALALVGVYFAATSIEGSVEAALTPPATSAPTPAAPSPNDTGSDSALGGPQQDPAQPETTAPQNAETTQFDPATARTQLAELQVKGRAPKTGYGREEQFGRAWTDVDRNGCKTRNDILARDLTVTELKSDGCVVLRGSFTDPYTGTHIDFEHGERTSPLVQIDHVVALSDAWQKGAQQLTAEQRLAFANDPLNLLAVDGPANSAKGDSDAASWLPPNRAYRCEFVGRQIAVKTKYGLWVTPAEHDAMQRVLDGCAGP